METHRPLGANSELGPSPSSVACPNCKAEMPGEMRFCRLCGYRIGEGVQDFTETMRLTGREPRPTQRPDRPNPTTPGQPWVSSYGGPVDVRSAGPVFSEADPAYFGRGRRPRVRRLHWAIWIAIACAASGASFRGLRQPKPGVPPVTDQSYIGAGVKTVQNGVLILGADPPDGPVDKAGLIGGDIIVSLDGKPIQSEKQLKEMLGGMHAGKTVDVLYQRDGRAIATKINTISHDELNNLKDAFENQPGGRGKVGVRNYEQIDVPGLGITGVKIGSIEKNLPANMAGIQAGDIVITYDGTQIRTAKEFELRIERTRPRTTIPVEIVRAGEKQTIQLTVGEK